MCPDTALRKQLHRGPDGIELGPPVRTLVRKAVPSGCASYWRRPRPATPSPLRRCQAGKLRAANGLPSMRCLRASRSLLACHSAALAHRGMAISRARTLCGRVRALTHGGGARSGGASLRGLLGATKCHPCARTKLSPMCPVAQDHTRADPVARAPRSSSAKQKDATHLTAQGWPVHSFRTLLDDLGGIVRNTCRRKGRSRWRAGVRAR